MCELRLSSRRPPCPLSLRQARRAATDAVSPAPRWYVRQNANTPGGWALVSFVLLGAAIACSRGYPEAEPTQVPRTELPPAPSVSESPAPEPSDATLAGGGLAGQLEFVPAAPTPVSSVPWMVQFEQPRSGVFATPEQALNASVRLRDVPRLPEGTELRLKVDNSRSWSPRELERRGITPEQWTLRMLVDELHGLQAGPHQLSVFAATAGVVVREPELALTTLPFTIAEGPSAANPKRGAAQLSKAASPPAFWFTPEGTLNGSAAEQVLVQFHVAGRDAAWLRVTAPDASHVVHELSEQAYLVSGWVSGDYHFALLEAAAGPALVDQVVTVNLDLPASDSEGGAW